MKKVLFLITSLLLLTPEAFASQEGHAQSQNCTAELPGWKVDKKQTFPFDHEPFNNSCFVTFYKFDNPPPQLPSGEKFFLYRDGKKIFEFPGQSEAAMTRVNAASFQDLNGDGLTDIIVATNTEMKSGMAYDNAVYANDGKTFTTNGQANMKLDGMKSVKKVSDFVKQHKQLFFK